MPSAFRPTTSADLRPLSEFLTRAFHAGPRDNFVDPAILQWKYWNSRDDFTGPRSFVIEKDGCIVAHAGLWPMTLRNAAACERGVSLIDWASDPGTPGAGVSILQRITRSFDFVYSIGGTAMTIAIMPKCGFHTVAEAKTWARPLRPWIQARQHGDRSLRAPARLARNWLWSRFPAARSAHGWTARESHPEAPRDISAVQGERSEEFFRFLEQCPAARCLSFQILKQGNIQGLFELVLVQKQARIAGLWLLEPTVENWRMAFQLAQDVALRQTDACEIIARSAARAAAAGAESAGMRLRERRPILVCRKSGAPEALPLQFHLLDNDNFFLAGDVPEFLT